MTVITHTAQRRARCWIDDLPDAGYTADPGRALLVGVPATAGTPAPDDRSVAVELTIPRGPRSLYRLLGATLRAAADGRCVVVVDVLDDRVPPVVYRDAAASQADAYHTGLPAEYAEAVARGVSDALAAHGDVPAGVIHVDRAVTGLVGSSAPLFRHLGATVAQLLLASDLSVDSPAFRAILDAPMRA